MRGWRDRRIGIPEHTSSRGGVRGRGGSYVYIYVLTYVKRVKKGQIRLGRGRLFTPGVGCERGVVRACRAARMGPGGPFRMCEATGCEEAFFVFTPHVTRPPSAREWSPRARVWSWSENQRFWGG